ncbi:MAG: XRE family transcriptional regulator [Clostridia bacterium]|nr:XRE family transcriptional regulator [Clostridia bacterium]
MALLSFNGKGCVRPRSFISTPELTTSGMFMKCWRRQGGRIFLYKGGTSHAANAGQEPYCEYYASRTAEAMGIKHIKYGLSKWQGVLSSVCGIFTGKDVSYVPMWKLVPGEMKDIVDYLKGLGGGFYDEFADMMVFDALIYNTDRHCSNFGLLFDSHTNRPMEYAPVFDNGSSLFTYAYGDDFKDLDAYAETRPSTLGSSFDSNARIFMSDRQRSMLRRMTGFKFKRHPRYNWPNERLEIMEKFIRRRVRFLLSL